MIGPTRPPEWLRGVQATAVADHQDVDTINEPPPGDTFFAASFPVCQTDENGELKVAAGRGLATIGPQLDGNGHRRADTPLCGQLRRPIARRMAPESRRLLVFGHDLLNAYRQWPVRRPSQCGTLIFGDEARRDLLVSHGDEFRRDGFRLEFQQSRRRTATTPARVVADADRALRG